MSEQFPPSSQFVANLPDPDVLAQEIVNDLQVALEQMKGVLESLED